jgi:hypothetical protein
MEVNDVRYIFNTSVLKKGDIRPKGDCPWRADAAA